MQDISRDDFGLLNGGETVTGSHTEKDMCPTLVSRIQNPSPINPHALALPKHFSTIADDNVAATFGSVKLEDTNAIDLLFPTHPTTWQQHPMNSQEHVHHRLSVHHRFDHSNSKLLLQGSDDPLISHGANSVLSHDDEHPADFAKTLLNPQVDQQPPLRSPIAVDSNREHTTNFANSNNKASNQQPEPQRIVKSGCSSLTKQQLKVKANLMSARNQQQQQHKENNVVAPPTNTVVKQRSAKTKKKTTNSIKLRFHHQALPPEYLSHYEATQGQGQSRVTKLTQKNTANQQRPTNHKQSNNNTSKQSNHRNSHENVRSWLQKIAEIQRTANASKAEEQQNQNAATHQKTTSSVTASKTQRTCERPATSQRLSLDANNNPQQQRRLLNTPGQGQVVTANVQNSESSGQSTINSDTSLKRLAYYADLPYMGEITLDNSKPRRGRKPKKADICHLIYKNYGTILPKRLESQDCVNIDDIDLKYSLNKSKTECDDQPLNLCLRDQPTDSYSISSADDISETNSSCPTPITTPSDFARDSMLASNLKNSLTNLNDLESENIKSEKDSQAQQLSQKTNSVDDSVLNPLTMYYHKLLESGVLLHNANGPIKTIQKDNQLALKIPIPSGLFVPPHRMEKPAAASPIPTNNNNLNLEYPEPLSTPSSVKSENSTATNASSTNTIMGSPGLAPQKRKRSAIFIPPMNVDNTSNPTTEVSICKFKFTGGSKPTLQEKKMLSVDAGGNYRYFSGTGDKTTRGYEYFPRESLQQTAGLLPGVNCTGQKLLLDIPPPSLGLSNDLLHMPESPTSSMLLTSTTSSTAAANGHIIDAISEETPPAPTTISPSPSFDASKTEVSSYFEENSAYNQQSPTTNSVSRKKQAIHQLRKSSQREKLEKTFKEQGFLIQTQQLEAEGATYCKFRQLKKFTRYLFRNWKDYLPSDLPEDFQRMANTASAAIAVVPTTEEDFPKRTHEKENGSVYVSSTTTTATANLSIERRLENSVEMHNENIID